MEMGMIGIMEMIKTTMEMRMISGKMLVTTTMTETIKMKMKTIKMKTTETIKMKTTEMIKMMLVMMKVTTMMIKMLMKTTETIKMMTIS
jgi:hypothetical protein